LPVPFGFGFRVPSTTACFPSRFAWFSSLKYWLETRAIVWRLNWKPSGQVIYGVCVGHSTAFDLGCKLLYIAAVAFRFLFMFAPLIQRPFPLSLLNIFR